MGKNRDIIDNSFYLNVRDLMVNSLPYPRLKPKIFVCDGEWLPLVKISSFER